ncbi:hypothetical protein HII36_44545 [Nonomuraea sp. NN258]|uniref:hypothetical protein n=1 Tax=Nonomuraea antri TaxID=2730852 RepID=UPI0015689FFC|nr:hypothetical protein [Nonomuraea antri]NRQ38846.1 hypothetical protein [Nonomuraea antri]
MGEDVSEDVAEDVTEVVSVIPADPRWQPSREAAERCAALLRELLPEGASGQDVDVEWHEAVTIVHPHEDLTRIVCHLCGRSIDPGWLHALAESSLWDESLTDLQAQVPCCRARVSLTDLTYEEPCGFARFEIAVWNPGRGPLTEAELARLGAALGHEVRQIRARV